MNNRTLTLLCFSVLVTTFSFHVEAADEESPASPSFTEEQKKQAAELDAQAALIQKETALINAQNLLRKAKVDASTPDTGAEVKGLSGTATGSEKLTFAMYVASLDSLKQIAKKVCSDLSSSPKMFVTSKSVPEAISRDIAVNQFQGQLNERLRRATTMATDFKNQLGAGTPAPRASAASAGAVAMGIDAVTGMVKGVAELASLFKTERTLASSDNLITAAEVNAMLTMCSSPPKVHHIDDDVVLLSATTAALENEMTGLRDRVKGLKTALDELAIAKAKVETSAKTAPKSKKQAELNRIPVILASFQTNADALLSVATGYIDAYYTIDGTTGLSPIMAVARDRMIATEFLTNKTPLLTVSLLKSSGVSLTTKRVFLSDKVAYGGGVSMRVVLMQPDGRPTYDRLLYRQSDWIRVKFDDKSSLSQDNLH